jgi:hypothetical protein
MTCIVGIVGDDGTIYMGADSNVSVTSGFQNNSKDGKMFVKHGFIYGFSGSPRMLQIVKYDFIPPEHPREMNTVEYMCSLWIPTLRRCFERGGFLEISNNVESADGTFLVGYKGKLFCMYSDF